MNESQYNNTKLSDTLHNNTKLNDIQHNNTKHNDTQHKLISFAEFHILANSADLNCKNRQVECIPNRNPI